MKLFTFILFSIVSMFFVHDAYSHEGHKGSHSNLRCVNANNNFCEDLLNFPIDIKIVDRKEFVKHCNKYASGCAVLSFKTRSCTIYFKNSVIAKDEAIVTHETNHCYGWGHGGKHGTEAHNRAWRVYKQLVRFMDKGVI